MVSTPIDLEGGDSQWAGVPSFLVPYTDAIVAVSSPVAPASNAALSAVVQTVWDAQTLYVRVQVTDPVVVYYPEVIDTFETDAVEVYLDGTDSRLDAYDAGDYELAVTAYDQPAGGPGDAGSSFLYAAGLTDAGYEVELGVPFSLLGANAGTIGFDVAIDGNDGGGDFRESQLMWSGDGGAYLYPWQFGTLTLSSCPCPCVDGG